MMELEAEADTGGAYVEGIRLENKALSLSFRASQKSHSMQAKRELINVKQDE